MKCGTVLSASLVALLAQVPVSAGRGNADYPKGAIAALQQGLVIVVFDVDKKGKAYNCRIKQSAGASLDKASCAMITKRSRFNPATDDSGKAVPDLNKEQKIVWRLPAN